MSWGASCSVFRRVVALFGVLVALTSGLAVEPSGWAQQAEPQTSGPKVVRGELTEESERLADDRYAEVHTFEVPRGWTAGTITYAGNGFRPTVALAGPNDERLELTSEPAPQREEEDEERIRRGRVSFLASESGTHTILVSSSQQEQTGRYRLRIALETNPHLELTPDEPHAVRWPGAQGETFLRRFRLYAPEETVRIHVELSGSQADADLHIQHGARLDSLRELGESTWKATTPDGEESLVLDAHSEPPLTPGWLYIYLPLWNEQGRPTSGPDEAELVARFEYEDEHNEELVREIRPTRLGLNRGDLHGGLPRRSGRFVETWRFDGSVGERIEVDLRAESFDAKLRLITADGRTYEDRGREETERTPRLVATLEKEGPLRIEVSSIEPAAVGEYTLGIYHDGHTFRSPQPIEPGLVKGQLSPEDERLRSGEYTDWYALEAQAGQTFAISLVSYHFDGYLFVRTSDGANFDNARRSAAERNPFSHVTLAERGILRIGVSSAEPEETGVYRLYVEPLQVPSHLRELPFGDVVAGTLDSEQATRMSDGRFAHHYKLELEAGEATRVAMVSDSGEALDAKLEVTAPDGLQVANEAAHAETRSPAIEMRAHLAGTYRVTATSTEAGMRGDYRMRAVRVQSRTPMPSQPAKAQEQRRYWGIFAGSTEYEREDLERLPYCREDAKRVARAYREAGAMSSHNQVVLLDEECTVESIRHAFERMATQVAPGDVFVFFFSGHGSHSEPGDYPDQLNGRRESILTYDGWIYDEQLNDMLDLLHDDALKAVAIDACFSGGFARQVISAPNRMGFFSSEMDVTSTVAADLEFGGYLSAYFYKAITGQADLNEDGKITVGELKDFLVRRFAEVEAYSEDRDGNRTRQTLVYERGTLAPNAPFLRLRDE